MDSSTVRRALRDRYPVGEYALFFEVANAAGFSGSRYCDAMAMGLWPSRGLPLQGFEIKVSRSDWLRELKQPAKAENHFAYCDHWWLVAAKGVVKELDEIPSTWGFLELGAEPDLPFAETAKPPALRQRKPAPKLTPKPLDRSMIAAILKRASQADEATVQAAVRKATEQIRKDAVADVERRIRERTRDAAHQLDRIARIEKALGHPLADGYEDPERIGQTLKAIEAIGVENTWGGLRDMQRQMQSATKRLDEALATWDALKPAPVEPAE